ncbi:MAG: hypothetical protein JO336_12240 [Acidobacteriia bacterium]|nr:hypothetical protein [Terriglobia bacterium]MBV8907215.1 hypothetical protein [Terriglobia bacterium]
MKRKILVWGGISLGIGLLLFPAAAQDPQQAANKNYTPPKTPWGEPDLQGIWPLNHLISTPFQRPEKYGERRYMTDEEYAAAQKSAQARNKRFESGAIPQADSGTAVLRLTSLLSDPPNGRFPALTPKGKELYEKMHGSYKPGQTVFDSPNDFDSWDRCITRGMPVSMLPRNYNNGIRIMQSPGYVLIVLEMAHEVRIIPTNGQPPLEQSIREWMGESRGHWEGNTLVVETTNFNGKTDMTNAGVPGSPPLNPTSPNMHITERFKRTAEDTIDYEMRVEDPEIVVSPWTVQFPLKLDNKYQMFEYACHEGNTAIRGYIETSRFERAHPKAPKQTPSQ